MKNKDYKSRIIDNKIQEYLKTCKAICIEGPKWCGKTWTSINNANSAFFIGDPENDFNNQKIAKMNPSLVLQGAYPRLIDEWQEVPSLWDAVKFEVDKSKDSGKFILTGSSTPKNKGIIHSGIGRITTIKMNTMSLYETGDSSGQISLFDICNNKYKNIMHQNVDLKYIANILIRGGFPDNLNKANPSLIPHSYYEGIYSEDIYKLDNYRYSSKTIELLLKELARNESTTISNQKMISDIKETSNEKIDKDVIAIYLDALKRMFITNNIEPFSLNVRSSLRIKKQEKKHLTDTSLTCAILNLSQVKLLNDLNTFGFVFEQLVEHDLGIYASAFNAKIYHYQDYKDNEIDSIIEEEDGSYSAIEIKLGTDQIDKASKKLLKIKDLITKEGGNPPKSLIVISGLTNASYIRDDGVYVASIFDLKN